MKRLSVFCHSVWQLIYLLLALEPILGIYDGYLYCAYLLCPIGFGILVCLILGVDGIQKVIINEGNACRIIYILIIATGIIISYISLQPAKGLVVYDCYGNCGLDNTTTKIICG